PQERRRDEFSPEYCAGKTAEEKVHSTCIRTLLLIATEGSSENRNQRRGGCPPQRPEELSAPRPPGRFASSSAASLHGALRSLRVLTTAHPRRPSPNGARQTFGGDGSTWACRRFFSCRCSKARRDCRNGRAPFRLHRATWGLTIGPGSARSDDQPCFHVGAG